MTEDKEVQIVKSQPAGVEEWTTDEVVRQVTKIQEIMEAVMVKDQHYGVIPGTHKPTLLKPGAEKLGLTFRLTPKYLIRAIDYENGHREVTVECELYHINSGAFFGHGTGSCTTMESKYRYRWQVCEKPSDDEAAKKKTEGVGRFRYKGKEGRIWQEKCENPNIADEYNTVRKIAKKRAYVDAMLTATGASDIFTQDVDEINERRESTGSNGDEKPKKDPQDPERRKRITAYLLASCDGDEKKAKEEFEAIIAGLDIPKKTLAKLTSGELMQVWTSLTAQIEEFENAGKDQSNDLFEGEKKGK
jgi:hypothetical protein